MRMFRKGISDPLSEVKKYGVAELLKIESVFRNGDVIPRKYTCDDVDVSPPMKILNVPEGVRAYSLIMYDPDAPMGTFYHWLLYDIPSTIRELPENIPRIEVTEYGIQGVNDFGRIGYGGPCPPHGHGRHRYFFLIVGLRDKTGLKPGARVDDLLRSVRDKAVGYGLLMGVYSR